MNDPLDIDKTLKPESAAKPAFSAAYTLSVGNTLGQYKIIRLLGRGGMGEVYEAENAVSRKRVALKVLPRAATGGTFVERFRIESRVMSDLRHENIVQVHHPGEDAGIYYMTMDLITDENGEPHSLEDMLRYRGRLPQSEVAAAAEQICDALAYAHAKGVVHRDLKPANILIAEDGTLRVTDFGLAKVVGSAYLQSVIESSISLSMAGAVDRSMGEQDTEGGPDEARRPSSSARALLGTYDYMAPEQKTGGEITPRADIYAVGVLLYRMLTGEKPEGRWKLPSTYGVSKRWDAIVGKCMERNPADRYASVSALKRDIAKLSRTTRFWKWAAALLLLAAAGGGYWAYQNHQQAPATPPYDVPGLTVPISPVPSPATPETADPAAESMSVRFTVRPAGSRLSIFDQRQNLVLQQTTDAHGVVEAELEPGRYEIEAQHDGFQLLSQALQVTEATTLSLELTPLRGALTVFTTPEAEVQARSAAGNIRLGKADAQGELRYERLVEGEYTLTMAHPDFETATATVTIIQGRPQQARQILRGKPGSVYVSASPQAEVWVDDERKGSTGALLEGLTPGERRFEVRRAGFRTERFTLDIPPNREAPRKVLGDLVRESGSIRIEAEVPTGAQAYFEGLDKRIRIGALPAKTVRTFPHTEAGLSCEEHEVRLEVADFTADAATRRIQVRDGQTATARFALTPLPVRLTVTANAAGAEVFDATGRRLGAAGTAFDIASLSQVTMTIRAAGHADKTERIGAMDPGRAYTHRVTLEPRPTPVPSPSQRNPTAGNVLGMQFVEVKEGSFQMGTPSGRYNNERPVRTVRITRDFWIGKYEVTHQEYQQLTGNNLINFKGDDLPVERVSWNDAVKFCEELTRRERAAGRLPEGLVYRLPTEAEWEFAARGGANGRNTQYAGSDNLDTVAWHSGNSQSRTQRVGTKATNELGLHDMSGNVWEWVHDWDQGSYSGLATSDPSGPRAGSARVLRGGGWNAPASYCRVAYRGIRPPSSSNSDLGFRVVVAAPVQ